MAGRRLIVSGWVLYAAVYAGFAFVSNSISVWVLFLIYGIYFGLAEGAEKALVADLVRPEQRGTAYGLYNLAFGITVLPRIATDGWLVGLAWPADGVSGQRGTRGNSAQGAVAVAMSRVSATSR